MKSFEFNFEDAHMREIDRIKKHCGRVHSSCMGISCGGHKEVNVKDIRILKLDIVQSRLSNVDLKKFYHVVKNNSYIAIKNMDIKGDKIRNF